MHAVLAAGASLVASTATPQSFNIDLDNVIGGWGSPHGPPRNGFGGAAGQAGFWEAINAADPGPVALRDVRGNATSVVFRAWGGVGSGGGWQNRRWVREGVVNDDFWLLMGDAAQIGAPIGRGAIWEPSLIVYTFEDLSRAFTTCTRTALHPTVRNHRSQSRCRAPTQRTRRSARAPCPG
ncbi:MAG: hypothetical protein AB1725_09175, partial [Armatimonadota bacterium]